MAIKAWAAQHFSREECNQLVPAIILAGCVDPPWGAENVLELVKTTGGESGLC